MTLAGGPADATVEAVAGLEGRLARAMDRALGEYLARALAGLRTATYTPRRLARFAEDDPARVTSTAVTTDADWVAAMSAGRVAAVVTVGYDDVAAAVTGAELPGPLVLTPDVAGAARRHVAAIRSWAPGFAADVAEVVARGVESGASSKRIADDLAARVTGVNTPRGLVIARTEANAAQNAGRTVVHDASGAPYWRAWASTPDARVRLSHAEAHGQLRGKGEPFMIGGWLADYPGDTNLPAGERVHCRCSSLITYDRWTDSEVTADQREWRARVRQLAADDGMELAPELAAFLS